MSKEEEVSAAVSPQMKEAVDAKAKSRPYISSSDYLRDLIRKDMAEEDKAL